MRSLMELLNTEHELIQGIERNDNKYMKEVENRKRIEDYPVDCVAKFNDLARIDDEIATLQHRRDALELELDEARKHIKEYFNLLMNGEAKA